MNRIKKIEYAFGLLIGVAAFFLVIPYSVLFPSNIGWLGIAEDTRTYFLGWDFYRHSPWQLPISANPRYGMEISGSIFMTDTIPLIAIPLKAFNSFLPIVFQYHGIWLGVCFALQGLMAWQISSLLTSSKFNRALITALFLFPLPFLSRATGHLPLMGHFFILAALLICLRKYSIFSRYWVLVIAGAACTNAYLLLMVLGLWFSDCARRAFASKYFTRCAIEFFVLMLMTSFLCWQVGYFSVGGGVSAAGNPYGLYRFNLLSPIDSNGWSLILKDIPGGAGDYEGFTYLGVGVIFLALAAFFACVAQGENAKRDNFIPGNKFLIFELSMFCLYAITNHIGFGSHSFTVPLPEFLNRFTSIFRGAGRLVWPALYFFLVLIAYFICQKYTQRVAACILLVGLALQIADTSAGWLPQKRLVASAQSRSWDIGLKDPFWKQAGHRYKAVRRLPAGNVTAEWSKFATYANSHNMQTDSVYLARVNYASLDKLNQENGQRIATGNYDADSLYILSDNLVRAALLSIKPERDLIATVDGYTVIAPNWKSGSVSPSITPLTLASYVNSPESGSVYEMTGPNSKGVRVLGEGWSDEIGIGGVWSLGEKSTLTFPVQHIKFNTLNLSGFPLLGPGRTAQLVHVRVNDEAERTFNLSLAQPGIQLTLTPSEKDAALKRGLLTVGMRYEDPVSPKTLGINADNRVISFALQRVSFE